MTLKSRLEKLERSIRGGGVQTIRRPADVAEGIWQRAMELLADYAADLLHPWRSLEHVVQWCREVQPDTWEHLPDPVMDVVARAEAEAETGELPPDRITRTRNNLASLAETPEEKLVEYLRGVDAGFCDYGLPLPYSSFVLEEVGEKRLATVCSCHTRRLRRGEITAAEHAALLARLLPPVTRADQENAVRKLLEMVLEGFGAAEGPAQASDAAARENPTGAENARS